MEWQKREDLVLEEADAIIGEIAIVASTSCLDSFTRMFLLIRDAKGPTEKEDLIDKILRVTFPCYRDHDIAERAWLQRMAYSEVENVNE